METLFYTILLFGISQSMFALVDSFDKEAFQKAKERSVIRTKKNR